MCTATLRLLYLFCLALPLPAQQLEFEECTVGVASARATADGRPLLWKNRDTSQKHNEVIYLKDKDGRYQCLTLITAGHPRSAWAGVNEKGFCIMNSVSRDLAKGSKRGMGNGPFMRKALQSCATVEDFEAMLQRTERGLRRGGEGWHPRLQTRAAQLLPGHGRRRRPPLCHPSSRREIGR